VAAHAGRRLRSERKYRRRRAAAALVVVSLGGAIAAVVLGLGSGGAIAPAAPAGARRP
jgi:hypothetical protein